MPYLILLMAITLVLAIAFHFKLQLRKTAPIRQALLEARAKKELTDLHSLQEKRN